METAAGSVKAKALHLLEHYHQLSPLCSILLYFREKDHFQFSIEIMYTRMNKNGTCKSAEN